MAKKFGMKEVADVTFYDTETGVPVLVFDTLKASSMENSTESTQATGGRGNANLINWDFGRKAVFQMQDALLSMESLALLAGNDVEGHEGRTIYKRERIVATDTTAQLSETPAPKTKVQVFKIEDGALAKEPVGGAWASGTALKSLESGSTYIAFYEYAAPAGAKTVKFSTEKFPSTYKVVGDTIVRDQTTGHDRVAQIVIPKAQLQSGFTLTMDAENVSTFDFNLDVMKDVNSDDFYTMTVL